MLYMAHFTEDNATELFETLEEAKKWLQGQVDHCLAEYGVNVDAPPGAYISVITHEMLFEIDENKSDYRCIRDAKALCDHKDCPLIGEDYNTLSNIEIHTIINRCGGREWPHYHDWDYTVKTSFKEVEER